MRAQRTPVASVADSPVRVFLSLGSNLKPELHLPAALTALRQRFGEITVSPAYRCASVGFAGPDFVNLAVGLDTDLSATALHDYLHALEDIHGRRRDVPRFSSRTLDIDIVLYGDQVIDGPGHLQIPRDDLRHAFVLKPIADIAPDRVHPLSGRRMGELWTEMASTGDSLVRVPLPD